MLLVVRVKPVVVKAPAWTVSVAVLGATVDTLMLGTTVKHPFGNATGNAIV